MAVVFNPGGSGSLDAGAQFAATFTFVYDTWQSVEIIVDLDNDIGEFWFDGDNVHTWQWTLGLWGTGGALQLAANDFYGLTADDEMYFDDYVFTDLLAPFTDDFESYTVGGQLACQNPTDWTTWNLIPCDPIEDVFISNNYAYSGTNSFVVVYNNDFVKPLGTQTTGKWDIGFMIYLPTGKGGYFNCMAEFFGTPRWWALDVYLIPGGTAVLNAGVTNAATWTYLYDTWQSCRVIVDLDLDLAEFWFDGVMIHTWQWTLGNVGQGVPLQLDAVNFWGPDAVAEMYVDDFMFGQYPFVPVELTSFTANVNHSGQVELNWSTATETNNQMFEIERGNIVGQFTTIGYVEGNGTTTEPQEYSYIDNTVETGTYFYRLKQIDFLGTYEYSNEIEVDVIGPLTFNLEQNYPNPFNPSTNIKYTISESGIVKLAIYNTLGEEVAVLVDGIVQAGFYEVTFDASSLPSGAYFYRLQSDNLNQVKKMLLMK
jgi:hypothetical protein